MTFLINTQLPGVMFIKRNPVLLIIPFSESNNFFAVSCMQYNGVCNITTSLSFFVSFLMIAINEKKFSLNFTVYKFMSTLHNYIIGKKIQILWQQNQKAEKKFKFSCQFLLTMLLTVVEGLIKTQIIHNPILLFMNLNFYCQYVPFQYQKKLIGS